MIRCIIIEDQAPALRLLTKYISDAGGLELKATFVDALSAIEYLQENEVDLIFLDVHLPKISGIEFVGLLKYKLYVILTTAFNDYALKAYDLDVVDYLLKPYSFERFLKAVYKVKHLMGLDSQPEENGEREILLKEGYRYKKLKLDDIIYVKSEGDYTKIVCSDKSYLLNHPLKKWIAELPVKQFCQVHRSYLINLKKIDKASATQIFLNDIKIPIGRKFKENFKSQFSS